ADHVNGIDDLRGYHLLHKRAIPCYGSAETIEHLSRHFSYIFTGSGGGGYAPLLEPHTISGRFQLFGLAIQPVPLIHGCARATGYRIGDTAYLTDCSRIPETSMALLSGLDTLILDALRYTPHPNHFNIEGALTVREQIRPRRTILTHLTHEVAHKDGIRFGAGIEFAYDGMVLE
ncbi:MAG: MBL fold metallo-hydrolase, partial [Geobacteraceae bacterium]|nr:MBL fold metallo-hydrolase [Geobacteraceae bacterium]